MNEKKISLNGYGVELQIKNMEYNSINLNLNNSNENNNVIKNNEIMGINFKKFLLNNPNLNINGI
jgi:hypothetical protein